MDKRTSKSIQMQNRHVNGCRWINSEWHGVELGERVGLMVESIHLLRVAPLFHHAAYLPGECSFVTFQNMYIFI